MTTHEQRPLGMRVSLPMDSLSPRPLLTLVLVLLVVVLVLAMLLPAR